MSRAKLGPGRPSQPKAALRGLGCLAICVLGLLTSCAEPPTPTSEPTPSTSASAQPFQACLVASTDAADSLDKSAAEGLNQAQKNSATTVNQVISADAADYPRQLQAMVGSGCDLVFAVGEQAGDPVAAAARTNPQVKFALIDASPLNPPANLKPIMFAVHEPAFQAGYLAAGASKSGKVGVYAGMYLPTVTGYLDGFAQGVEHYNAQHGTKVELLGWDPASKTGLVIRSTQPFQDVSGGRQLAEELIAQGADVIMPVAGDSGAGAIEAARVHDNVKIIWAGIDCCQAHPDWCSVILASVVKAADEATQSLVKQAAAGDWSAGIMVANLRNDGVALQLGTQSQVDAQLVADLDNIKRGIANCSIQVRSDSAIG